MYAMYSFSKSRLDDYNNKLFKNLENIISN